jgi:hypothetical protein
MSSSSCAAELLSEWASGAAAHDRSCCVRGSWTTGTRLELRESELEPARGLLLTLLLPLPLDETSRPDDITEVEAEAEALDDLS